VPFPKNAGAVKGTAAEALPPVAEPIVGAFGLRPSPDATNPVISIGLFYHNF
jgi:hypothetical protein